MSQKCENTTFQNKIRSTCSLRFKQKETSPKGFSASKCDAGNWIFSKLGIFWIFSGFLRGIFWIFWRNFLEEFFGRISFGGIFNKIFLGGIFCLYC